MAEVVTGLPPGFVLDAPAAAGLPQGFVLDAPTPPVSKGSAEFEPGSYYAGNSPNAEAKWGAAESIANGLTLGAYPNIMAAVGAATDVPANALGVGNGKTFGENYDANLSKWQGQREAFGKEHPAVDAAGNVAGGLMTGGGAVKAGLSPVANAIKNGAAFKVLWPVSALEGAGWGAASGFGNATGSLDERLAAAKREAPVGAVVGALAAPAMKAVDAVAGAGKNLWNSFANQDAQGEKQLVQALMRDKTAPNDIASRMEEVRGMGNADYAAVDAFGKNARRVGAVAAKTPSEARDMIEQAVDVRKAGAENRVLDALSKLTGDGSGVYQTEQQITNSMKQKAGPLYDAAFAEKSPAGPAYDALLQKQSVQDAIGSAKRTAAERQIPITDLFTTIDNPSPTVVMNPSGLPEVSNTKLEVPTTRGWDYIKRELDSTVDRLFKSGDTTAATAVKETRNALRSQLSQDNPKYAEALKVYADDRSALEAIDAGRALARDANPDEAIAAIKALDTPEKQALARMGFNRERSLVAEKGGVGRNKAAALQTTDVQNRLAALVPDDTARAAFNAKLAAENDMSRANNQVLGGSSTAENLVDMQKADTGSLVSSLATGRMARAAGLLLDPILRRTTTMTEGAANRVGDIMMSKDPEVIRALQRLFLEAQNPQRMTNTTPTVSGLMGARGDQDR